MTDLGTDLSCTTSLRTGRYVTGTRLVAEAAFRRLTTPRGTLFWGEDEADYGLDLTELLLGQPNTTALASSLEGRIRNELKKDERIDDVSVAVVTSTLGAATTYDITIDGTTATGTFTLTIGASDVSVDLLGLAAEGT
jgi:hypothetical protein